MRCVEREYPREAEGQVGRLPNRVACGVGNIPIVLCVEKEALPIEQCVVQECPWWSSCGARCSLTEQCVE